MSSIMCHQIFGFYCQIWKLNSQCSTYEQCEEWSAFQLLMLRLSALPPHLKLTHEAMNMP